MSLKSLYDQIEVEIFRAVQRGSRIEVGAKLEVFRMIPDAGQTIDNIHRVIANYNSTLQPTNHRYPSALPFGLSTLKTTAKTNAFRSAVGLEPITRNRNNEENKSAGTAPTSTPPSYTGNLVKEKWTIEFGFHLKKLLPYIKISREQTFDPPK